MRRRTPSLTVLAAALALASTVARSADEAAGPRAATQSGGSAAHHVGAPSRHRPRSYLRGLPVAEGEEAAALAGARPPRCPAPQSGSARATADASGRRRRAPPGGDGGGVAADESVAVPGITDDNTFVDPGANPFVAPADDRLSTFGLDVDTGSFTVARTFLDQACCRRPSRSAPRSGSTPSATATRPPDAEAEDAAADLAVSVEGAPAPFMEDDTQLVRVGIKAARWPGRTAPTPTSRWSSTPRARWTSGSGWASSARRSLLALRRDTDTVAVVTYGDTSNAAPPPRRRRPSGSSTSSTGSSPRAAPTWRPGCGPATAGGRPSTPRPSTPWSWRRTGWPTPASPAPTRSASWCATRAPRAFRLVTVGYGMGNYNDDLMEQLADRGDGFYSYVDTYEEPSATAARLDADGRGRGRQGPGHLRPRRRRLLPPGRLREPRHRRRVVPGRHRRRRRAGRRARAVTALYELRLVAGGPESLGTVTLRHRPVGADAAVEQAVPVTRDDLAESWDEAGDALRLAGDVAALAELLAAARCPPRGA